MSNFLKHDAMLDSVLKPVLGLTNTDVKHAVWVQSSNIKLQA